MKNKIIFIAVSLSFFCFFVVTDLVKAENLDGRMIAGITNPSMSTTDSSGNVVTMPEAETGTFDPNSITPDYTTYDLTAPSEAVPEGGAYGGATTLDQVPAPPAVVPSATTPPTVAPSANTDSRPKGSGLIPCGNSSNPGDACTVCDFFVMAQGLMQWGLGLLFILAGAGFFISGILYIVSAGNSGMMTKAKGYLKLCVMGVAIVLLAWLMVNTTMWILGAKRTGIWYNISC